MEASGYTCCYETKTIITPWNVLSVCKVTAKLESLTYINPTHNSLDVLHYAFVF